MRHAFVGRLIRRLAGDVLAPGGSQTTRDYLAESQVTGSQPQEGELSLTKGNSMQMRCGLGLELECINSFPSCEQLRPRSPSLKTYPLVLSN